MANYANQKTVEISNEIINQVAHKERADGAFLRAIDWKYIRLAQQVLSGNEFTLLTYMLQYAGKGYYEFSPASIEIDTQMSDTTAQRALKRLQEVGYVESGDSFYKYKINLYPKGIEELAQIERGKKLVKREEKNNARKEREVQKLRTVIPSF